MIGGYMKADIEWEAKLVIPDEITEQLKLHEGDVAHIEMQDDGSIIISFDKKVSIEVDLPESTLFALMQMAHERDIILNQLVTDILTAELM
jgi:antitoxin component of MazEF toxin-antitoxin module